MKSAIPRPSDADAPLLLSGAGLSARARRSPSDPSMAHLTIFDPGRVPHGVVLEAWLGELRDHGFTSVRTGAITERSAAKLEERGFHVAQSLALLSLDMSNWQRRDAGKHRRARRLQQRDFAAAAATDRAAFGDAWAMDPTAIRDTCDATPFHRSRAYGFAGTVDAYAVTGRSGRHGFVQRLAVHPSRQRHGLGRLLLDDGLRWLQLRRAHQVFVNTQVDNAPALELYASAGFLPMPEGLRVMELSWA